MPTQHATQPAASDAKRFQPSDKVVATEQADTTVLMDLRSGRYYTLNSVSGVIWSLLTSGASVDGIVSGVMHAFDAPEDQVTEDVEEFLENLLSSGLIRHDA